MFGIFDSRVCHNLRPVEFSSYSGNYTPAIYSKCDEALRMAEKMNSSTKLTTYIVKPVFWTRAVC